MQSTCASRYADQRWQIEPRRVDGGAAYSLVNVNSRRCLILQGAASGTQAVVGACNIRYDDQLWLGVPAGNLPHP